MDPAPPTEHVLNHIKIETQGLEDLGRKIILKQVFSSNFPWAHPGGKVPLGGWFPGYPWDPCGPMEKFTHGAKQIKMVGPGVCGASPSKV